MVMLTQGLQILGGVVVTGVNVIHLISMSSTYPRAITPLTAIAVTAKHLDA